MQLSHKSYILLSSEQYLHAILVEHLHLLIEFSSKYPLLQISLQFPKSKYFAPTSGHFKQLLLVFVGPLLHVLQFSWHLSIVLSEVLLQ